MASSDCNDPVNPELDDFRQQWISDLQSRREQHHKDLDASNLPEPAPPSSFPPPPPPPLLPASPTAASRSTRRYSSTDDRGHHLHHLHEDGAQDAGSHARLSIDGSATTTTKELVSALDHYEEASEKEAQGNMGESLRLYRKAYRLDNRVDKVYREKHHAQAGPAGPAAKPKPAATATATATATGPSSPSATPEGTDKDTRPPLSIDELIASFSALEVQPAPPIIEGDIPPPCPVSNIPDELLVHIMAHVAASDVGDLARLALVCKRLAYLVATEQRPWKRVCLGREFGFLNMHRVFTRSIEWQALHQPPELEQQQHQAHHKDQEYEREAALTRSLVPEAYPSWRSMFRTRPRLRFNGCYISTVNYIRSGMQSTNQATWGGAPVLIVTYYRYLRFFPDGTLISLLTTTSPAEVVHHLTRDELLSHRQASHAHPPSSFMHQAFRGRWRLSSLSSSEAGQDESELFVETEGPSGKYTYRMELTLQSGSKSPSVARNTKLAWKRFSCYNKLTDDWADFHLKNDKPYFFSRVRSYGLGFEY